MDHGPKPVVLTEGPLSIEDVVAVARGERAVAVSEASRRAMLASRGVVERCLGDGQAHYGINTGFGSLSRTRVGENELRDLQRNLIRSHAAGVGAPLPAEIVRGMMLLLAASLGRGRSGVRPGVVELLVAMLNQGVTPVVPSVGSVGASGDLAPLAAIGMALIGEAQVTHQGMQRMSGETLRSLGLAPITLEAKEGLAIINGTHMMAAIGALLMHDCERLFGAAVGAAAMAIDASRASHSFLDARVHAVRNQPGQVEVAARIAALLAGSQIVESHRENDPRVQDPYCLRCAPQVLGAAWSCLGYVKSQVERELGGVTDNPLVFTSGDGDALVSAGNFHGMPIALPLDCCAIAISHVAGISERRTFWMLSAFDSESHLPPYLARKPGVNSGLMIAQYTAAACCNEIVTLCTPASPANVVTSAGIEDYNSFGPRSAMKARRAVELARYVVGTELLCGAEALEHHRPLRSGAGVERLHAAVRSVVAPLTGDRPPGPDIEMIAEAMEDGAFG